MMFWWRIFIYSWLKFPQVWDFIFPQRLTSDGKDFARSLFVHSLETSWPIDTCSRIGVLFYSLSKQWSLYTKMRYNHQTQLLLTAKPFLVFIQKNHIDESVGNWLHEIHKGVGFNPDFVGSCVVDVAWNYRKSIWMIEWYTQGECPQKIFTALCNYCMSNMLVNQASGTSGHNNNLNPECDESPSKIHSILVCMKSSGTRMSFYDNIQN